MKYFYAKYNGLRNDKFYFNNIRNHDQVAVENKPTISLLPTEILGGLYEVAELANAIEVKHKQKYEFIIGEYYVEYGYKVIKLNSNHRTIYKLFDMELDMIISDVEYFDLKDLPPTFMGKCIQLRPRHILLGYTATNTHKMKKT